MMRVLTAASKRSVRVVLLLPGAIDNKIVRHASRAGFGELFEAGIEIYEYQAACSSRTRQDGSSGFERARNSRADAKTSTRYPAAWTKRLRPFRADGSSSTMYTIGAVGPVITRPR